MYIILNQAGEKLAYVQNHFILDENQDKVIGILIGDCFFGKRNAIIGKIFNETVYLLNGEVVGKIILDTNFKTKVPNKTNMLTAWELLSNIKNHTSHWITETNKWSKISLLQHLAQLD